MESTDREMLVAALMQKDVYPKALANFMFREVIEDAHCKYNISQEDMKSMCQEAVNRAMLFIAIKDDPDLYRAFAVNAIAGAEWDESEITEGLLEKMDEIHKTLQRLSEIE